MNTVIETAEFARRAETIEKRERDWIERMKHQLRQSLSVGKPLGTPWFREKKLGNRRLFFVTNPASCKAALIAFGTKKEQQAIITDVRLNREAYLAPVR
jgi:hypothetical protein